MLTSLAASNVVPSGHRATGKTAISMAFGALLAVGLFAMGIPTSAIADSIQGAVVGVTDGDTVKVLDASKKLWTIRLSGIDSPEKRQPFGERAKQNLSDIVFQQAVTVHGDKNDRYGRLVGKVVVNGRDANLAQIRAGLAWHYKKYQKEQTATDREAYAAAEQEAAAAKRGLWSAPNPTPPWDWRKSGRVTD